MFKNLEMHNLTIKRYMWGIQLNEYVFVKMVLLDAPRRSNSIGSRNAIVPLSAITDMLLLRK